MGHTSYRRMLSAVAVVAALVVGSATLYSAVMADAPDVIKIEKFKKTKGVVELPHKKHVDAGIACKDCHHTTKDGETPAACTTCHTDPATGDAPDAKKAFHKNCQDCHKKTAKEGKKSGPTKCGDCHKA